MTRNDFEVLLIQRLKELGIPTADKICKVTESEKTHRILCKVVTPQFITITWNLGHDCKKYTPQRFEEYIALFKQYLDIAKQYKWSTK